MMIRRTGIVLLGSAGLVVALSAWILAQEANLPAFRDGFESERTSWQQEHTDATVNLLAHERSRRAAHDGRLSERFEFVAGIGSAFYYSYALPKLPVTGDLKIALFVRSNRIGARLSARVVLPSDTDPDTGQPSFVMVPGTAYENSDRWQRIELTNLAPAIERQARVLRAATRRPVSLEGAYIERLVVNLFGGAGQTEVFLDDLTIAPVTPEVLAAFNGPGRDAQAKEEPEPRPEPEAPQAPASARDAARVRLDGGRALVRKGSDGNFYDWVMTAIDAPGADVVKLRHAGFDVLADPVDAEPKRTKDALKWGFLLMPNLDGTLEGGPIDAERMLAAAADYPFRESVALWNVGDRLGRRRDIESREAERERVRSVISGLRSLPEGVSRLAAGSVDGDLPLYARAPKNISVMAIEPNAWASAQEPVDTFYFLRQRRDLTGLANPGGLFLAWLPAGPPASVVTSIWGNDTPPGWGMPQVQPEQIRLFTYLALAAGYRGIGFRGNAGLTGENGVPLLNEMALLNEEIDLFESIIARGADPIPLYNTYYPDPSNLPPPGSSPNTRVPQQKEAPPHPSIRVAGITTQDQKGVLLLVLDMAAAAQFQPSQMAIEDIYVVVPAPESAQAFEISPGDVRPLDEGQQRKRVPGGVRVSLRDFSTTSLILVTTDFSLPERLREAITRVRPQAVRLALEQARIQYRQVEEITNRLLADGQQLYDPTDPKVQPRPQGAPPPNDERDLMKKADEMLKASQEALEREDYALAWSEARRTGRTLRHLMFAQWMKGYEAMSKIVAPVPPPVRSAVRRGRQTAADLKAEREDAKRRTPTMLLPVASPPLASYNTLPQHYLWVDWMAKPFGANLIPSGSFDDDQALESEGWINQSYHFDKVTSKVMTAAISEDDPSKRCIKMTVEATDKKKLDDLPAFLDFPAAAIRTPPIRVSAGQFLRISVLVRKDVPNPGGQGGIVISDSIGGEALQFRSNASITKFSKVVLFRRVPTDGPFTVTLGLAGFGEAYFDDFRVETVTDGTERERPAQEEARRPPARRPATRPAPTTATRPTLRAPSVR